MAVADVLGHVVPPSLRYNPADPWGQLTGNQQPGIGGEANRLLGGAGAAGLFSPTGSPAIMAAVRRNALRASEARRQQGMTLSSLLGLDPQQAAVQFGQQANQAAGEGADAINNAQLQQLLGGQEWYRNLFNNRLGNADQQAMMRYQAQLQRQQQGGLGGMFGTLLGTGVGAFLGGPGGAALGSSLGGRLFGGGGGTPGPLPGYGYGVGLTT